MLLTSILHTVYKHHISYMVYCILYTKTACFYKVYCILCKKYALFKGQPLTQIDYRVPNAPISIGILQSFDPDPLPRYIVVNKQRTFRTPEEKTGKKKFLFRHSPNSRVGFKFLRSGFLELLSRTIHIYFGPILKLGPYYKGPKYLNFTRKCRKFWNFL